MALTKTTRAYPPTQGDMLDETGKVTEAWAGHFTAVSDLLDRQVSDLSSITTSITALNAAAAQIGDLTLSFLASKGSNYLPCRGGSYGSLNYPALSAMLLPVLGDGGLSGHFLVPNIPNVLEATGSHPVVGHWFIKAL